MNNCQKCLLRQLLDSVLWKLQHCCHARAGQSESIWQTVPVSLHLLGSIVQVPVPMICSGHSALLLHGSPTVLPVRRKHLPFDAQMPNPEYSVFLHVSSNHRLNCECWLTVTI